MARLAKRPGGGALPLLSVPALTLVRARVVLRALTRARRPRTNRCGGRRLHEPADGERNWLQAIWSDVRKHTLHRLVVFLTLIILVDDLDELLVGRDHLGHVDVRDATLSGSRIVLRIGRHLSILGGMALTGESQVVDSVWLPAPVSFNPVLELIVREQVGNLIRVDTGK